MIRHLYLFQRDLDDDLPESDQHFVIGRRMKRSKWLLGRCIGCGAHLTKESVFCAECLGTVYCSCHDCMQLASLHRMLQNDLYWAGRDHCAETVYRDHLIRKIERIRDIPSCGEVAA